mmetsp:Transcript_52930/g.80263  ORF Transcript_52930/g.80263 Transcript_52930/m.80263 type:complete len:86 (+) Transcript_52930:203-460(+)
MRAQTSMCVDLSSGISAFSTTCSLVVDSRVLLLLWEFVDDDDFLTELDGDGIFDFDDLKNFILIELGCYTQRTFLMGSCRTTVHW